MRVLGILNPSGLILCHLGPRHFDAISLSRSLAACLSIESYLFGRRMTMFLLGMKRRENWAYYLVACGAIVGCWGESCRHFCM